jgi:uncharacterized protein (UPF0276 family)
MRRPKRRRRIDIGVAYNVYLDALLPQQPDLFDYVEVPVERLFVEPTLADTCRERRLVLHSASLSLAGAVPPADNVIEELGGWIDRTRTPWLGEHLAFTTAPAPAGAYEIGFTMAPRWNDETLRAVVEAVEKSQRRLGTRILLENPPQYFSLPGSAWSQTSFIRKLCSECDVGLLLDLAHLSITAHNLGVEAGSLLDELPLDRVVEVHLSGAREEGGVMWDDHAERASEQTFELLDRVARAEGVRAVTLEYNWSSRFPTKVVVADARRLRRQLDLVAA